MALGNKPTFEDIKMQGKNLMQADFKKFCLDFAIMLHKNVTFLYDDYFRKL